MKNTLILTLLACAILLFNGCTKKYSDTLPQVQFISASPYGPDSVLLTGTVTNKGQDDIQYVGFSYYDKPTFDILQNQVLLNGTNGTFSYPVYAHQDTTYYFKCFAANTFGYAVSSTFKYTVPHATPDTAPCSLTSNAVTDNSVHWSLPFIYSGPSYAAEGAYGIEADDVSGSEILNIQFKQVPVNGIYNTVGDAATYIDDTNPYDVFVTIGSSFVTFSVNSGYKVYVAQNKDGTTTVSFCTVYYTAYSHNYTLSGKVTY